MYHQRHLERRETLACWPVEDLEKREAIGLVTNLTEEGLQIHSNHDFHLGQVLTVRITVDAKLAGTDHISLIIENAWCHKSGVQGLYHAGFHIKHSSDRARKNINSLLQAFSYPAPLHETIQPE